jgi:amino acid adenylation domain-containing protein
MKAAADAPVRTTALSPEKLALLVRRAQQKRKAAEAGQTGRIPRRSDGGPAPLSFAQQRLWLLDLLEPGSAAYNMPCPARLRGELDVAALSLALGEIVRRHGALRTTFQAVDGVPVQVVSPPVAFPLPVIDLSGLAEPARDQESERLTADESKRPFDLEWGPLLRAALLRRASSEHLLLLDLHHIISDGWSLGVLFRELSVLYGAFRGGEGSPLSELPLQFIDFAAWQRDWLQGAVLEEQLGYWRERLAGSPPALELPTDRLRPAVQTHRGVYLRHDLPRELAERLRSLSHREGASTFMTLLAGFDLLLSRLSGQEDVVVGSPSAGRGRVEIEGLIGLFLNTLVLRADLSGDPSFQELLGRVKEAVLGAYQYQDLPFEKLIEELQPERQLSRTPIFQVLFNFVSVPDTALELSGLGVEMVSPPEPDAKFDFTLYVEDAPEGIHLRLVYNADLFDRPRMEELLRQLEHLLAQVAANPEAHIGALSLVTPAAAAVLPDPALSLSGEWRGAPHQALSRHAMRAPERIAARDELGEIWTYGELEARSNQLARFLRAAGVGTGDAVAIWAHRSASLVWAILGTLKAGAAFMVFDPAYPAARLLDYLRIARPTGWLAVDGAPPPPPEVEECVAGLCRCRLTLPRRSAADETRFLADFSAADPEIPLGPDDAACITFTSGSTGVPKGVVGRHGPLTHFYPWIGERFGLGGDDCFGMLSALSHDPLQRDVFTPLWFGASLAIPDPDGIGRPGYLAEWVRREKVSVLHLTPAMMEMLIDSAGDDPAEGLPALRHAFVVGDLLKKADVESFQRLAPALTCVNLYGSTETQRSVSYFVMPRPGEPAAMRLGREVLPLGRGMEGVQLLVLNRTGHLAGIGEAGEIHVRSRHLARGYLGDDALTAERFLPNPFTAAAGDRIYKTGDLGRYLSDGSVEFAGRADHQVKLRGFRIELGEVEAALARYPEVHECVAIVREDRPGDRRLVAYLVTDGARPQPKELRAFLSERLPEYMVPSAFVVLPALPLTRTGKVDRKALLPPVEEQSEDRGGERSPVEELLAGIWADLLGVGRIAAGDNFFELGGQSLLATRMASRVRNILGIELPARAVFEEPTLAGLAAFIERAHRERSGLAPVPPLAPVARNAPLPLSFSQQRLWFLDQLEPGSFAYNLAGALLLRGLLDAATLAGALSGVVRRHESLRTTFREADGQPWQVISPPAPFPLPIFDLSGLPPAAREKEAQRIATAEARRPYQLARGPLLRSALLQLGEREHALLIGMHHIVSDGWSMGIFVRELGALYRALAADEPSLLPELPIQYADFAVWQRQLLTEEVLDERLGWWMRQLRGAPPLLNLPLDRSRPLAQSYRGGRAYQTLEDDLEPVSRRLGVTPFMVLVAGFTALLSRYGSQHDLVVGTPIANRGRAELEDLIGFFANTLALRVDLSGDPGVDEVARRVREVALGAYAHQDMPFERLVEALRPARDLSHSPVFQVMLAWQNLPVFDLELAGLSLSPLEFDAGRTQYDLSLFLFPRSEGGALARLEYAADLFDAGTAERLLAHLRNLLAGIAEIPERRLSELPLLAPEEREQMLVAWNQTTAEVPDQPVQRLFRQWAERTPDALALAWNGSRVTYRDLAGRVECLAAYLRGQGVGGETIVALCFERSAELITAALAVLEAGGAYLPLDPAQPADRRDWMLRDSGAAVLLTPESLAVAGLEESPMPKEEPAAPACSSAEGLAYVIYTSGSTGRPKGTQLCHGGLSNLIAWHRRTYGLGPGDRTTLLAGPGFDAAVWEIWAPLTAGACLHIPPPETVMAPAALARWLADEGITVSFLPTPLAEAFLLEPVASDLALRLLLTGGDRLLRRPAAGLPYTLVNHYGPTESTVVATAGPVAPFGEQAPEIGSPIANTRVYVLDPSLQPVPMGVPGELCLAGVGLARGYHGRPELTAERFVPDPFGAGGVRLYRTGDLARWRPAGVIEFLGRTDAQVKIRGFRIELGEIESVLGCHPAVRECAVVARDDVPGSKRLVAYLAFRDSGADLEPIRDALRRQLPEYMVPSAFVVLPALPLTANGKIDRRSLPAPAEERHEGVRATTRSPSEELLAGIWADLLRIPAVVSSNASFFDLGGHSLLAARMISRVRGAFGVELPMRAVFEQPTLAGLADFVEQARRDRAGLAQAPPLVPVPRGGALPLSFSQQRLWFLDRLEPGSFAYNLAGGLHLAGPLDIATFRRVVDEIVRRHESLRTTFAEVGGEPVQVIAAPAPFPLPLVDLASLTPATREAEARRIAAKEARQPFDLGRGPLFRMTLLRFDERKHALVTAMHHIVSDGWSIGVLVRELGALYRAFIASEPSPLPELPVQYADFAVWQRRWLSGETLEAQLAWWTGRLAGAPALVDLPLDRPRPAVQSYRGGRSFLNLEADLEPVSRRLGVTPYMLLLGGLAALLARYGNQTDVVIGTPIANRGRTELEDLIGFFANTLALRVDLSGDPGFGELSRRVRETALGAYAHQDLPFEHLVEELRPVRDLSHSPVFQVMLALQNLPPSELELLGLTLSPLEIDAGMAPYDLSLFLFPRPEGGLLAQLVYASDLLDAGTAERLLGHLRTLLEEAARQPETRISRLPLLTEAERAQLAAWDRAERRDHSEGLLHELFEAQARATPEAGALVAGEIALTYAELEERSARLAARLRALGAGPETGVAVCLPRTADLVVALLAVLRAGAFYVPLDPRYPQERLRFLLDDSGARILVTASGLALELPGRESRCQRLDLDAADAAEATASPSRKASPRNLAYLIYTSGSTGRPKAVAIEHRSAVVFARWARASFSPWELRGVLASTAVTFDLSVFEIFVTLAWGGTVVLAENALELPAVSAALPSGVEVTLINTVPSALVELLREDGLPSSVRTINLAGEALPRWLADRAYERLETGRLCNLYGPSEDTTYSTWTMVERTAERPPAIGRPVHDTRAYVLDAGLERLPVGVPGELFLAGAGLARGYLGRPDLTAERFLPDPFVEPPGGADSRMYRTGDLVRLRPDGELEYLGRLDHQVKLRGFRIELGEVEAALARLPGVESAVVLARDDIPGDKRLVAYVAAAPECAPAVELRRALLQTLPEPMVPSAFVFLEALPLTPHGKVERRALPPPAGEPLEEVPHRELSPSEELLAGIWSSLLHAAAVGPQDHFFDLGGHSLLATQVVSRVREVLGVELPLRALFEAPVLEDLAARIEEAGRRGAGLQAPPLRPVARENEIQASFAQERLWFLDRFGTDRSSYNVPSAIRLRGRLDVPALAAGLTEIVRRHESLRTTFKVTGGAEPRVLQVIAPPFELPLPIADLAGLPAAERETEAARLAREEARRVFDLERGPLVRATLARLGEREHTLLLSLHHIVADGWSIGVLVRELSVLYSAFVQGRPSPLPELPVQYADFASWQRGWLQGEALEAQLGWWRERLAGAPAVIELPADRPRPPLQSARGGRLTYTLPATLSRELQALVRAEGATLFMALLAGFQALLARTTGGGDLPVGTPIANRNRVEIEGLIGFFVNTLVLRGDLTDDPSFRRLLARSREAALGAYAHQDVPFEKLVEELQPERDLSHSPLFQVMVILQNAPLEALELPDLTAIPLSAEGGTAKFDLRLSLLETPAGLAGSLVYNRDLFDGSTVARLGGYLENLLAAAVAHPELPISELALLDDAERHQLLAWGDAQSAAGDRACLHQAFTARAARAPERPAVTCAGERLSYRELDRRSNQLAHLLIAAGVGPGDLVGLCLERSLDMVVAILGVLKAGGAYLPLDPAYPKERLAFALEDSRVGVVITEESLAADLPAHAAREVRLDADSTEIDRQSPESPGIEVTPDFPAYVIYTSGSTGRPKGVVVTHANASRLLAATDAWFGFGPDDVWTLFHSYAFDFSVWELWGALLYGGRLAVVPYWVSRSPTAFYELVRDERVTVLNQTPSAFRQLIWAEESILATGGGSESGTGMDLALRYVIFGGEALELASLAPWYARHPDDRPRLVNMYGITETTVHVTYRLLSRSDVEAARGSVIGVPIPDLSLRVLDPGLRPQPIGVPGEIHVGGDGVALGYLGRPELTAQRFVPDPFGPPGARLYRSGDLARYLPDGDLEYLGRIDHQVKIRGFRIELGEIETALTLQPEIREAAVLAREDTPGERRLVAYLVAERELPAGELRDRLKAKLPEYMVPAAFVTLPALPLTANGKVDRKALPAPEAASPAPPRQRVAPRTGLERFLAELWRKAPGAAGEIGIDDDFFELGGNSITGAILINRLQEALGEIVHVVVIFDAPTIERMAAYLIGNHPEAVARVWGQECLGGAVAGRRHSGRIDDVRVAQIRGLIRPLSPLVRTGPKNPPAIFVLSPPRSGTTLMRVMLGGHPRLFAPPELELLSYNTLAERRASYTGRDAFWLEGLVRAVMAVCGCTAEEATETTARWADEGWTARRAYGQLQEWLGERILVDKTPSYALDAAILQRAEEDFAEPLYIHLVRHPYGMIRSFEEAKLDQIFFRQDHPFDRRELAELIWLVSQENILRFLAGVPSRRRHRIHFEELLREPEAELRRLCGFLGLEFDPAMIRPYEDRARRMTDGIHAESRMLGDVKFHTHSGIDATTAERWRDAYQEHFLGAPTVAMANALGYDLPAGRLAAAIPRRAWKAGELRPVSFAQQRLWFLDRLDPGSSAYNLASAVRLAGSLDVAALSGALGAILRRHESLRTIFVEEDGEPKQAVAEATAPAVPIFDLSGLPAAAREAETRRITRAEARRPFDLTRGPLVRSHLLRLSEREHALLIGMHHIISDGWSLGLFVQELGALYRALATGKPADLPELTIQYADFAAWQREWLTGQVMEERLAWWTSRLAGAPQVAELPLDMPRPAVRSHRGATAVATFGDGLEVRLEALSRRLGVTPFMALLAGFASLLHRYGGQTDVVVGTPIANRGHAEVEKLIGFFANTLALRVDLGGNPTFAELAGRVREMALGAYTHQDLPFEHLVGELRPDRDLSHAPVFQVVLALQNIPRSALDLAGLTLSRLELDVDQSPFDLSFFLSPQADGGLRAWVAYVPDLFEAATVQRLLGHFQRLLEGVAAEGGESVRLSELPLLAPAERAALLALGNPTAAEVPGHLLHQPFEAAAAERPHAVAVSGEGEALTYAELNARANRLAHHLRRLGVGPESLVAVCLERSPDLLTALLGVLKAGGAYVPLDPTYPAERIAWVLADSRASVLITQRHLASSLPDHGARLIALDGVDLTREQTSDPVPLAGPENPAYVIYTSGSTGRPKGVAVRQRGAVNFLASMARQPGLGPDDVLLAVTTIAFDISVLELFLPLSREARIELVGRETAADGFRLRERIAASGATVMQATPATWRLLLEAGWEGLPGLQVLCGGEALPPDLARELLGRTAELWNVYGPTETTVWSTVHPVSTADAAGARPIPLGEPVANTEIYLCGRFEHGLEPVPPGAPGELYVGGEGLARGYLGRPDLTAERFVPDPFGDRSGARLYRTGDLVRRRPREGALEYLGRADHQVKIRGFRIELGEIEAVLGSHPAVRECAVMVREDVPGSKLLVAYLVLQEGAAGDLEALRGALRAKLPEYMVPQRFAVLPSLPLTPNGKVDRRALPAPAEERREVERSQERRPAEELLAGIWAELLGLADVAAHESFFELGGHSLLATRMISRVRSVLGVEMPLRALFEEPTLGRFAATADRIRRGEAGTGAGTPPLVRVPRGGPLPVSFSQQRLWLLDILEPGSFAYNLAGAVRLEGSLDVAALAGALSGIARRHESLRTTFHDEDGEPRQLIAKAAPLPLPILDLSQLPAATGEQEARRLATAEARRPYDLARGPLVRSALLRLGGQDHALLVGMHHIISDGWSMGIFVRELSALYRAVAAGEPAALPELSIQYADFAVWQRQWLTGEVLQEQLAWWTRQLAGAPQVVDLPLDRPRPPAQSYRGGHANLTIGRDLETVSRQLGVTPYMALLAGFATLLYRYGSQPDLVVGTPIGNRQRTELEDLIGFFANTLALRVDLSGDPAFEDLAGRVREVALGAYAHQDIPFERLVGELRPERDLSHTPVFQVMLTLQNLPSSRLDLAGLALSPLEFDIGRTQFDLSLFASPRHDGGLLARLEYAADLFEAATAERLLAHLRNLLEGIAAAPERRLSELPLLAPAERSELLVAGNSTAAEMPACLLHQLFEAAAAKRPGALAVTCERESLTYAELNVRANRLAHRLRRLGVGPEALVGVCVERSPALLVAMLGVLKAGGAYVPLDPTYPEDRLAWVLEDSRAAVLLTERDLAANLPPHAAPVVALDALDLSSESAADPEPLATPEDLAYVIYTSGSTGRPKGVAVRQLGAVNFLASMARQPGLGANDVMLAVTTVAFDIHVLELFLPLAVGARVELVGREIASDGLRLAARIDDSGATVMQATPATWRLLLEAGWRGSSGLKVLCGGEALSADLARELLARTAELWNVYGPTETTVWSAVHPVDLEDADSGRPAPLGVPIANTTIYLLDRFEHGLEPVPPGAAGELYIGGEGLARGYLGRPDLTAERFVPDPFSSRSGARLYRTGDLVRRRPREGSMEFLGRADHQVKIRGFRIELGEIEAVLDAQPAVRECAVVVREDVPGTKRLVAYLALQDGLAGAETLAALREVLRGRLPDYMVPQLVEMPALPLTPNGKIDRRALLALPALEALSAAEHVAPRNPVEEALAEVWAEVLRLERVGIHDNFFALGGDSILAIQVVTRSRKRGVTFAPRQLFQHQTIAQLAAVVEDAAPARSAFRVPGSQGPEHFDFPDATLSQKALDDVLAELAEEKGP